MEKVAVFDGCNDRECEHIINDVGRYSLDDTAGATALMQLGQQIPGEQGQEEAQVKCTVLRNSR